MVTMVQGQRELCTDCNRALATCFCRYTKPFATKTRFIILMHPREFKRQRVGTGRVTRKSLINSEILVGVDFSQHEELNRILTATEYFPVLLFPGKEALMTGSEACGNLIQTRPLAVIIIDATWASARKMLRLSPNLQNLTRISFDEGDRSRFSIKRQPEAACLSTIEAAYRLLDSFDRHGYEDLHGTHTALMETLDAIVSFQLKCATDPLLPSHRLNTQKLKNACG